jgi:hypothetical protein
MQTSKVSPYPTERGNVLYLKYGRRSGSMANQTIYTMLASASLSTPSVASCGATTVWANGPIAPPLSAPILKRLRKDASMTIGAVDMDTMHVGSLTDKNGLRKRQTYDGIYNRQL